MGDAQWSRILTTLEPTLSERIVEDIEVKAELGRYRIRGFSTFQRLVHFDDIAFLAKNITDEDIDGGPVDTRTTLGTRFAGNPITISTPVYITGMSYGALSKTAKAALAKGAASVGTATCTGDGGMLPEERRYSTKMIYQLNASRYGVTPQDLIKGDAVEIVVGQGAKPATGGLLMGQKVSEIIAKKRDLPPGIDQRSPTRHPERSPLPHPLRFLCLPKLRDRPSCRDRAPRALLWQA